MTVEPRRFVDTQPVQCPSCQVLLIVPSAWTVFRCVCGERLKR